MKATLKEIKINTKQAWYLSTGYSSLRIRSVDQHFVVLTGQDLTQRLYHCTPETVVYDSPEEADKQYSKEIELLKAMSAPNS